MDHIILCNVPSNDPTWKNFRQIVEEELWKSDDHSVMDLTPLLDSTRSVVAKDHEGNYLGSVVWNEYDGIAFIGFYLVRKDLRGKGIGCKIWKTAIEAIESKGLVIGLRAVTNMLPKYQANGFPFKGPTVSQAIIPWKEICGFCSEEKNGHTRERRVVRIRELESEDLKKFFEFDWKVTGRDRKDFLRRFHFELPYTDGCLLFDEDNQVVAAAGITATSLEGSHLFKVAPLYASNLCDALTTLEHVATNAGRKDLEARIIFHILSDSVGENELLPLLSKREIGTRVTGTSIFSQEYNNPINSDLVYLPNNNSGHYDA